jgi:tRNA threonylcarbamoyladenosine modification (KEOPS) complex  Pcc1 subunit
VSSLHLSTNVVTVLICATDTRTTEATTTSFLPLRAQSASVYAVPCCVCACVETSYRPVVLGPQTACAEYLCEQTRVRHDAMYVIRKATVYSYMEWTQAYRHVFE